MKQPSCHKADPRLSEAEAYLIAVECGHLHSCSLSGEGNPADMLARLSACLTPDELAAQMCSPSVTRIQTGTTAAAMSICQPEVKQP